MMKRLQFLMGFLCGALLFCGVTSMASAASGIMATISTQPIYVDGQQVSISAQGAARRSAALIHAQIQSTGGIFFMLKSFVKHRWTRVLAFLLAVVTVIGLLPMTALADGDTGGLNPGSPGGQRPSTTNVAWSTNLDVTFLRFTLVEFPNGVVTDLNTSDSGTWRTVGTPLNIIWDSTT